MRERAPHFRDFRLPDRFRLASDYLEYYADGLCRKVIFDRRAKDNGFVFENNDKPLSFEDWLYQFKGVVYDDIQQALKEVELMRGGKLPKQSLSDFINKEL